MLQQSNKNRARDDNWLSICQYDVWEIYYQIVDGWMAVVSRTACSVRQHVRIAQVTYESTLPHLTSPGEERHRG